MSTETEKRAPEAAAPSLVGNEEPAEGHAQAVDGVPAEADAGAEGPGGADSESVGEEGAEPEGVGEEGAEPEGVGEVGVGAEGAEPGAVPAVGQGAVAVVSAGLGIVALTGSWVGTVASARASLIGQLETATTASVAEQVQAVYGDAWQATAVVGGAFALLALLLGAFVLVRPAFGVPNRVQAPWTKSVAWAGLALGVLGLALAVAKYLDLYLSLPSTT
ncbi:hypothetical protein [Streptomyces sp. KLOTTS4A1]|uniref:hypothetical protein n=1 Tax=Streptomyces sp. KLOTTS4A1 TaxID=3390996 RepID=UPI0039F4ABAD